MIIVVDVAVVFVDPHKNATRIDVVVVLVFAVPPPPSLEPGYSLEQVNEDVYILV